MAWSSDGSWRVAYRYFRGKVDLERLSLADLSKATEALATLERLAGEGRLGFEMGIARSRREPRQAGRTMQPQERAMLDAMPAGVWMSSREIAAAMPSLPANSLTARLSMMATYGWIEVSRRVNEDRPAGTRGRRAVKIYRRADPGASQDGAATPTRPSAHPDPGAEGSDPAEPHRDPASEGEVPQGAGGPRSGRRTHSPG